MPSMSRGSNSYDNVVAESLFSSLKRERIYRRIDRIWGEARSDLFDRIEVFYSQIRRHSRSSQVVSCEPENGFKRYKPTVYKC